MGKNEVLYSKASCNNWGPKRRRQNNTVLKASLIPDVAHS